MSNPRVTELLEQMAVDITASKEYLRQINARLAATPLTIASESPSVSPSASISPSLSPSVSPS